MRLTTPTLLLALALPAQAEVLCPDALEVRQEATIAGDWTVSYTDPPLRLTGVTIYDGPPSQNHKVTVLGKKHERRTAGFLAVAGKQAQLSFELQL